MDNEKTERWRLIAAYAIAFGVMLAILGWAWLTMKG